MFSLSQTNVPLAVHKQFIEMLSNVDAVIRRYAVMLGEIHIVFKRKTDMEVFWMYEHISSNCI